MCDVLSELLLLLLDLSVTALTAVSVYPGGQENHVGETSVRVFGLQGCPVVHPVTKQNTNKNTAFQDWEHIPVIGVCPCDQGLSPLPVEWLQI